MKRPSAQQVAIWLEAVGAGILGISAMMESYWFIAVVLGGLLGLAAVGTILVSWLMELRRHSDGLCETELESFELS